MYTLLSIKGRIARGLTSPDSVLDFVVELESHRKTGLTEYLRVLACS